MSNFTVRCNRPDPRFALERSLTHRKCVTCGQGFETQKSRYQTHGSESSCPRCLRIKYVQDALCLSDSDAELLADLFETDKDEFDKYFAVLGGTELRDAA